MQGWLADLGVRGTLPREHGHPGRSLHLAVGWRSGGGAEELGNRHLDPNALLARALAL